MGACLSLSRVSDDMPAPLPCAAPPLPVKDGAHLVGAGEAAGNKDSVSGKGLSSRVRALVPVAMLPPPTGQHAYQVVGELGDGGSGSYGALRLLRHKRTGELAASRWIEYAKGVVLSRTDEREIVNHRRLACHPHVLGFREVYLADACPDPSATGDGNVQLVVVTEHTSGGTLGDAVAAGGRLGVAAARRLFGQLADGLAHCHSRGVVHRALSVDTLLLTGSAYKPVLKIAGFGMSKSAIEESMPKTRVPSCAVYTPPELLAGGYGGPDPYDGAACDAWACGVCLFYMLAGRLPFVQDAGALTRRDLAAIVGARWFLPPGLQLSDECRDLLGKLLVADPKQRLRVSGMLRHTWLAAPAAPAGGPGAADNPEAAREQQSEADILATLAAAQARRRRGRLLQPRPSAALDAGFAGFRVSESQPRSPRALSASEGQPRFPDVRRRSQRKAKTCGDEAASSAAGKENCSSSQPVMPGGQAAAGPQRTPLAKKRPSEAAGLLPSEEPMSGQGGSASGSSNKASSISLATPSWAAERLHDAVRRAALERGRLLAAARVERWRVDI